MRVFGKGSFLNNLNLKPHNIIIAVTTEPDYDMGRNILIEGIEGLAYNEYLVLEGWHCSCYDFDETDWDAIVYTEEELLKLANVDYNQKDKFWTMVREHFK